MGEDVPGQGRQTLRLGAEYFPASHEVHCRGDVAAGSPLTDPAAQSKHKAEGKKQGETKCRTHISITCDFCFYVKITCDFCFHISITCDFCFYVKIITCDFFVTLVSHATNNAVGAQIDPLINSLVSYTYTRLNLHVGVQTWSRITIV